MQKKIAIVNDISGFGRCSVTVALPILSAMEIQCGIVPTAILSNHTEYPDYSLLDFTPYMEEYLTKWKQLHLEFDAVYTGFLGSAEQLSILRSMLTDFSFQHVIVDPVMGDHGSLYDSYTTDMCESMKELVQHATLTTPNLTELCILTGHPYHQEISHGQIEQMCRELADKGPSSIVVTGIENGDLLGNAIYSHGTFDMLWAPKILPLRPGTGDVFASIVAGATLQQLPLTEAVRLASDFISVCLTTSADMQIPINDGVCFESHLHMLIPKQHTS